MSVHTVEIRLKTRQASALRSAHHKNDTESALRAAIGEAIERAQLKAEYPRPHAPNSVTAGSLRSKTRGRVFQSKADFATWLKSIPKR